MWNLPQEDCGGNNDESNTDKWGFDGVTNNNDDVIADYGYDTEYDDEGDKRVSLDKEVVTMVIMLTRWCYFDGGHDITMVMQDKERGDSGRCWSHIDMRRHESSMWALQGHELGWTDVRKRITECQIREKECQIYPQICY